MIIHIIIICTNKYFNLGIRLINNYNTYYNGNQKIIYHVFTDKNPDNFINKYIEYKYYPTIHRTWQESTNSKFKSILQVLDTYNNLNEDNYIYYLDADTNIIKYFNDDILLGDLVGAEHFDNNTRMKDEKDYDRNILSKAYVPYETQLFQMYFHAAFFGGKLNNIKNLCKTIIENQIYDKIILNYEPIWNDESYINNYFHYFPPTKIIYYEDFPFIISDKDGMDDQRSFIYNNEHFENIYKDNNILFYIFIIFIIILILLFLKYYITPNSLNFGTLFHKKVN